MLFATAAITLSMVACSSSKSSDDDDDDDSGKKKEKVEDRNLDSEYDVNGTSDQSDNSVDVFIDAINEAASQIRYANDENDVDRIMNSVGDVDSQIDENYVLTPRDKKRMSGAVNNFFGCILKRGLEMSGEEITPEIEDMARQQLDQITSAVNSALDNSRTLGEFGEQLNNLF